MAATRETKSQPRISVSYLKPAKTAIVGYFAGGSIANIVQEVCLYLCGEFGAFTINPTIPSYFCTNLPDYKFDEKNGGNFVDDLFVSSRAGRIEQILQSEWFLEREEFSHSDRHSGRNPWS